jgi:hypothetical protein
VVGALLSQQQPRQGQLLYCGRSWQGTQTPLLLLPSLKVWMLGRQLQQQLGRLLLEAA